MRKTKTTAAPKADPQNKELVEAIRALCQEKDLSEDMLFATVEDALKKAYAKNRAKGEAELVNYRVAGRYMIVDRLFARAELRLGGRKGQQTVRIVSNRRGRA